VLAHRAPRTRTSTPLICAACTRCACSSFLTICIEPRYVCTGGDGGLVAKVHRGPCTPRSVGGILSARVPGCSSVSQPGRSSSGGTDVVPCRRSCRCGVAATTSTVRLSERLLGRLSERGKAEGIGRGAGTDGGAEPHDHADRECSPLCPRERVKLRCTSIRGGTRRRVAGGLGDGRLHA
jgi:hypothetical protein